MAKRQVFYSFHFDGDFWRTQQVRNIGSIEGNTPVSSNDWEEVKKKGDAAIKKWIEDNMKYRSCVVVLVGNQTANRKWVKHEIRHAWEKGKGVVGIRIHGLKDSNGNTTTSGDNPLEKVTVDGTKLSTVAKCYNPSGSTSKDKYAWIKKHMENAVEEAVKIRNDN